MLFQLSVALTTGRIEKHTQAAFRPVFFKIENPRGCLSGLSGADFRDVLSRGGSKNQAELL